MLYIDLNMVRAGVVAHPEKWIYGGYYHIHCRKRRMILVDEQLAQSYLGFNKMESFKKEYPLWINHALQRENLNRDKKWTESVAVGSESFLKTVIQHLGVRGLQRKIEHNENDLLLREPQAIYGQDSFLLEDVHLKGNNKYLWDL